MKNDVESRLSDTAGKTAVYNESDDAFVTVLNGSVTKPFITNTAFDPAKGELPVILPYSDAEKLLGLKKLNKSATNEAKLDRLHEVRRRIGEVMVSYCYRNLASEKLLDEALAQVQEIQRGKGIPGYIMPALQYQVPQAATCGPVQVSKDTRTTAEKRQAENRVLFEKEVGAYLGEPQQYKVTMRGVGISSDLAVSLSMVSVTDIVGNLLSSNLGYRTWVVPSDLLLKVPPQYRPSELFKATDATGANKEEAAGQNPETYMVEFTDKEEARALLRKTGMFSGAYSGTVSAMPFGSGTLIVDEMKSQFQIIVFWALIVVGGVAAIILGGIIGRTISEGRRESAIFRAIGAKRGDIAGIYGVYSLLLSIRIVLFATILGAAVALTIEFLYWRDATLTARLAYAASETAPEFHLFSIASSYIPVIIGVILVVGLLGSVVPIVRNARRNPINDMRDE